MTLQAPPPVSDHDLLAASESDLITENRLAASRRRCLVEFFRRQTARHAADDAGDPTRLTARQQVEVEISELWAVPRGLVRQQLNDAIWVDEHFGYLRDLGEEGRIDPYRFQLIAGTARHALDTDEEYAELARRLEPFLLKHLRAGSYLACTPKQLRNRLAYIIRRLRAPEKEEQYQRSFENRDVVVNHGEDGMSWTEISGTTDQVQLADHRLDVSARALRAAGDPRTLAQLRADLAIDLLVKGRTEEVPVPQYARPIINLTVPIQTVMGLSDDPGTLSGGQVIPAGLARTIAQRPGTTWHRMLTDPAGKAVELSTTRYAPTRSIWEEVVAVQSTCFRTNCDEESTGCDLDHRIAWPAGPTTPGNLEPACRTDHRVKHAEGFGIEQTPSGGFALRTAAGFLHPILGTDHPASDDWSTVPSVFQFSATELAEAIAHLRRTRAENRRPRHDLAWELDIRLDRAGYAAA